MSEFKSEIAGRLFSDNRVLVALILVAGIFSATASLVGAQTEEPASVAADRKLPEGKQTTLGLYVTAKEAYDMWKAAPDKVKLIDVRTPEEYAFVGHPDECWNVPLAFATYRRRNGITEYGPEMNPNFVAEVKMIAEPNDTLLLMCRSGGRSAMAVNLLAAAGLKNVYNVIDGFEGDKVNDPGSVFHGKRMRNGWKNSAPWVYTIDPEKVILEEGAARLTQ